MISFDPTYGAIVLYGTYPIITLQMLWLYLLAGLVSGVMVFFDKKEQNKQKYFLLRFLVGVFFVLIVFGVAEDCFNLTPREWVSCLSGFFAFPIFRWVFKHVDSIVEGIIKKALEKIGIEIHFDNKEESDNSK